MRLLNFKEVIANIKEGEVWESCSYDNLKEITMNQLGVLNFKYENRDKEMFGVCRENSRYKLKRKEVSFQEAFKAYEEGKEIESKSTDFRYKKINGESKYYSNYDGSWQMNKEFQIEEVEGKWYIND